MDAVNDLIPILTRFHREVVLPDIQRTLTHAVGDLREEMNARFVEVYGHFDAIYQRFDRLDGLQEQVRTLESRLDE